MSYGIFKQKGKDREGRYKVYCIGLTKDAPKKVLLSMGSSIESYEDAKQHAITKFEYEHKNEIGNLTIPSIPHLYSDILEIYDTETKDSRKRSIGRSR